ncbi:MAG: dTDP-4-dehydrorhamnose reductase [Deltaproteobacteria bacterium]|nr:dTDP-4-dehydrorhamnose reductase [Deltaproteobacteria bacterium]
MRIVVTGGNGQLAADLVPLLAARHTVAPLRHSELELRDHDAVCRRLDAERPEVVINTAAFHRVDDCEREVEAAFAVNVFAVLNLARWCRDHQAQLMHFSTDYVFAGDVAAARGEGDLPGPLSVYGTSKLAGEYLVRQTCPRHIVIRTCGLYGHAGSSGKGGNFVETMLRLAAERKPIRVVADQILTPTATVDLAAKVAQLLETREYGLYHITNAGSCSWFEFARKIFQLAGVAAELSPTTSAAFGAPARRPAYSVLRHDQLARLGLDDLPPWDDALARYLRGRC